MSPFLFAAPLGLLYLSAKSYLEEAPLNLILWDFSGVFSIGLRMDTLSGILATTVLTIGLVVMRYSVRYLDDDPQKSRFLRYLSLTLCFVLLMLLSPNLLIFLFSWIGTSYFLHHLLVHFSDRLKALKAASQKFWISRFGDLLVLSAGVTLYLAFGSLEFETIFETLKDPSFVSANQFLIHLSSGLLVVGAMTKSAQFPFHFWLPNTMETPTPVSALMHAGVINAGGYLVIRTSPLLTEAPIVLSLLALTGGFTAFYGSLSMLTQSNVKKSLAYSTIAQMGFMMLQCGLGAFSVAVVHIIGHAFYKAYAFLSSGTVADIGRLNRYFPRSLPSPTIWTPLIALFISFHILFVPLVLSGYEFSRTPGTTVLLIVLALAGAQIGMSPKNKVESAITALVVISSYLLFANVMGLLLNDIVSEHTEHVDPLRLTALFVTGSLFIGLYLIQNNLHRISMTSFGRRLYVRALNGK